VITTNQSATFNIKIAMRRGFHKCYANQARRAKIADGYSIDRIK